MTNGYNVTAVLPALERIGWLQPTTRGYDVLDCDNTKSTSGRYYNDGSFHAALLIENIYDCQPDAEICDEDFNCYLQQLKRSVALSAINAVFNEPQFIASGLVFWKQDHSGRVAIANKGNFCGLRLKPGNGDYGVLLQNALLLFDGAKTFDLYLFHSLANGSDVINGVTNEVSYIKKWPVTTKANQQVTVPLGYALNGDSNIATGGEWFLGYFQDDLGTVKALDYNVCCNDLKVLGVKPFESKASGHDFDREVYGESVGTYGLNLELSVYRDMSNAIVDNAHLFDNLQGLMMAAKVIELIQTTTRTNVKQRISKENLAVLYRDLNQTSGAEEAFVPGLKHQITQEVERIRNAFFQKPYSITVTNPHWS